MYSIDPLKQINPTDEKNSLMEKDLRYTSLNYGKRLDSYYLAYVPLLVYETLPIFGSLNLQSCFKVNFFHIEEYPLGVILLFNQLCNCTSSLFYIPVTMFQFITERIVMDKLWGAYYDILKTEEESTYSDIQIQNWKTNTILNIRIKRQHEQVRLTLTYIDPSALNKKIPSYSTDALSFLDYCQFFYHRFITPVIETNNYIYDCIKTSTVT